jgi:hypothetical protein
MKYKLLQIKDVENCSYVFSGFNFAQQKGLSLVDYEVVYEGIIEDYSIEYTLEKLFDIFNIYCPEDFKHKKDSRWFSLIPHGGGWSYGYYKDYSTFVGMPCSITGITKKDNSDLYILEITICRLLNESAETLYPLTFKYEVSPGTKLEFDYILSNLKRCKIEILDVKSNYIKYQTEDPAWFYY